MTRTRHAARMGSVAVLALLLLPLSRPSRPAEAAGVGASGTWEAGMPGAPATVSPMPGPDATGPVEPVPVSPPKAEMATIPSGSYLPLYARDGRPAEVAAFHMDRRPVSRGELLDFLRANPEWRKSRIKPVLASESYLSAWKSDLDPGAVSDELGRPATGVSWFAAKAYCRWRGARLPTVNEWEYAARADETRRDAASDPAFLARVLELATARASDGSPPAAAGFENVYGVRDLHGPVREWVADFNSVMVSDDSRGTGARDRGLYCASGASGASNTGDYAAFLRYAFRASLEPRSAVRSLGFRCAADLEDRR